MTLKAVDAMRGGACDFLMKPFEPKVLLEHVELLRRHPARRRHDRCRPHTRKLLALADKVAETDAAVAPQRRRSGAAARGTAATCTDTPPPQRPSQWPSTAQRSTRSSKPRSSAHEKAPSPRRQRQTSKFERAEGGTLLLDPNLRGCPLGLQAKLLR